VNAGVTFRASLRLLFLRVNKRILSVAIPFEEDGSEDEEPSGDGK
jgi:hypothetical protein